MVGKTLRHEQPGLPDVHSIDRRPLWVPFALREGAPGQPALPVQLRLRGRGIAATFYAIHCMMICCYSSPAYDCHRRLALR
jgi:hypothetical protein